jgi:spore germination cell wall hydrolase CwlJ-like protein
MCNLIIKTIKVVIIVYFATLLALCVCDKARAENLKCLASTVYHESRGESHAGKIAIAKVVMNRTLHKDFGTGVCSVIRQRNQFSWVKRGGYIPIRYTDTEMSIARRVYYNPDDYNHIVGRDVLFFQSKNVRNNWQERRLKKVKTIGGHNFYRYRNEKTKGK